MAVAQERTAERSNSESAQALQSEPAVCRRLERLRQRLVEERQRLVNDLDVSRRDNWSRGGVADEVDVATVEQDAGTCLQAMASELGSLAQVDDALLRMRDGTYGRCEECGQLIAPARLRALPFAALCRRCKEQEERGRPPGESARPIGSRLTESHVQAYWSDDVDESARHVRREAVLRPA